MKLSLKFTAMSAYLLSNLTMGKGFFMEDTVVR